jgi:hypothetical protein
MGSEVTFPSLDEISGLKNNPQDFDADVEAIPAPWADYVAFAFGHCGLEELPCEYLQKASETYEYCSVLESTSLVFVSSVWGHATKSSRSRSTGFTTDSRRSSQEVNQTWEDIVLKQFANFQLTTNSYPQRINQERPGEEFSNDEEDDRTWELPSYPPSYPQNFGIDGTQAASVTDFASHEITTLISSICIRNNFKAGPKSPRADSEGLHCSSKNRLEPFEKPGRAGLVTFLRPKSAKIAPMTE